MTQEGSEYFVKILVKTLVIDIRVGDINFVLCGIRCVYNLRGKFSFVQNTHTCEHNIMTSKMIKLSDATFQDSHLWLYNGKVAASLMISSASFENVLFHKSCDFHLILHNTLFQEAYS